MTSAPATMRWGNLPLAGESGTMTLRQAIDLAAALLAEAGVDSARCDAEQLAAHLAGTDRGRLPLFEPPGDEFFGRYRDIVTARARRVPLQHLIGTVSFGPVVLHVGRVCLYRVRRPKPFWPGPPRSRCRRGR